MKTPLNTHNIELPDGRLMTIEGGDAASVAQMLSQEVAKSQPQQTQNQLVTQQPTTPAFNGTVAPLVAPVLNFSKEEQASIARQPEQAPVASGGIAPLVMPVMNFEKPAPSAPKASASAQVHSGAGKPLTAPPPLTFFR